LTAESAAARGDMVFAGLRDVEGRYAGVAAELRAHASGKIHPVELDVTSDESVEAALKAALELSEGRLDVVVNNAGVATLGLAEAFTSAQLQALFEVNVFGPQRVNRAALPTLRGQRSGLIVYVSSGLGRVVIPVMGPYCASKFAGEALGCCSRARRAERRGAQRSAALDARRSAELDDEGTRALREMREDARPLVFEAG